MGTTEHSARRAELHAARVVVTLLALAAPAAPAHQPLAPGRSALAAAPDASSAFSVSTLNVHCPAYRKLPCGALEKDERSAWLARHARILALELWETSDFVALQEVWYGCEELTELYVERLRPRFHLHGLRRGHRRRGRTRPDGLLTAVSKEWAVVAEVEIDFADVGDRCAMLLHVRKVAGGRELLVVNTHLLFPHNASSKQIQLREVHKLLDAIDAYKRTLGGRPLPLVLAGDLNAPPGCEVPRLLCAHGLVSSFHDCNGHTSALGAVTHRTHEGALVACDYIFSCNPSARRPQPRRWDELVLAELWGHMAAKGCGSADEAFALLCDADETFERERGARARAAGVGATIPDRTSPRTSFSAEAWFCHLTALGLHETCAHAAALTDAEMRALHAYVDANLDGQISLEEWRARMAGAVEIAQAKADDAESAACDVAADCAHAAYDIAPVRSTLTPGCLALGEWPGEAGGHGTIGHDGDWVSDHGAVTTAFEFVACAVAALDDDAATTTQRAAATARAQLNVFDAQP
jgi:endonuclease/exonuclease/phosphatase family metal-dependent hydrolase